MEFGLVLPLLMMLLLGLIDASRLLWSYTTLLEAVQVSARCAAVDAKDCGTLAQVQAHAAQAAWGLQLASSAFTVTTPACGIQVNGTMIYNFITPWFYVAEPFGLDNTVTLNAAACYPVPP